MGSLHHHPDYFVRLDYYVHLSNGTFRKGQAREMQKVNNIEIEEEIEEGQQLLPSTVAAKSVLLTAILLMLGVLACIILMVFYPVAVLGIPLIAIVAYFIVRRR